nr:unnamed protein product [Digitaria exilis]
MALKTEALTILLLVSLAFTDHVRAAREMGGGGHGQELVVGNDGGAVSPKEVVYPMLCSDDMCVRACRLQMGGCGRCKERRNFSCSCFPCH